MTSASGVRATADVPNNSEPESLDSLAYDDWEGQFEFVGNNNNNNNNSSSSTNNSDTASTTSDVEDLNLAAPNRYSSVQHNHHHQHNQQQLLRNCPILIDEETFLSMQSSDEPYSTLLPEQPNQLIENALKHLQFDNRVPSMPHNKLNNSQNHTNTANQIDVNNSSSLSINHHNHNENIIAMKNRRNCQTQQSDSNNNHNSCCHSDNAFKMSDMNFAHELYDSLLKEQLEILQRQVSTLADSQSTAEDRTSRTKTEHAVLQARYHMLEDQLREVELRAEERINEEQKRHRELLARVEREAILQNENCQIKIRTIELETNNLREELQRLRTQYDKQTAELRATEEKLEDACDNLTMAREELTEAKENVKKYLSEKLAAEDLMIELGKEVERLRSESGPAMPTTSPETLRLEELHQELEELRQSKKQLIEQNEELQAMVLTRGVEEGRNLLNGTSNSLAQEIDELNDRQLQAAYQEKEEENLRLKHYIDTILLNIVENYPQILEVKTEAVSSKR
ncbi:rab11 family-interacting protein 4B isoform X2 [Sitodiplosis mosellana]|uniref:rab11 family-interacting protein 4B isoform X2 n=1 Tax=Sitodiplosis mosellana TaxID=263140 RepID=UPI002443A327|nr:rab11 family-interacting protein 4B isoform X2 [Sitodiplosis mosellana]XP_055312244.1 rab11 family-interacting protein 4B isoform X2 [Sitodiplosis mosellana]XP_055312245.1 rab11 family-interacting protein 4B isoform X2 [Sitodiplosis mosellana]XP_055312246.1 rab11 family-interacting protein 4B isoform X2 [Sitodiplosis mosellana]XP_055312247.1 rab11 family-interacting protein 4B isoform X2 [Sitodiplosis mosellana]